MLRSFTARYSITKCNNVKRDNFLRTNNFVLRRLFPDYLKSFVSLYYIVSPVTKSLLERDIGVTFPLTTATSLSFCIMLSYSKIISALST